MSDLRGAIVIAGTVDVDPEQRAAALEVATPLMMETRELPGCLDYVWAPDLGVPGRIYVYERWEGEAPLAAHFEGRLYREMRDTIGRHGLTGADVLKYRTDLAEPVYDEKGRPRADFRGAS